METIVLKAIEKDPDSRYAAASELAADLERFLEDVPIRARRASLVERFARWSRRNRRLAGSLLTIATLLAVLAASSTLGWIRENGLRSRAENLHDQAEAEKQRADDKTEELRRKLYASQISRADLAYRDDRVGVMQQLLNECPEDLRDWEWDRCNWLAAPRQLLSVRGFELPLFTPDGRFLIAAGHRADPDANAAKVWDARTGEPSDAAMIGPGPVTSIALRADGKRLATGYLNGRVAVWDFESRRQLWSKPVHSEKNDGLAFSHDGTRIASVSWDQTVKVLDATTGDEQLTIGPTGPSLALRRI